MLIFFEYLEQSFSSATSRATSRNFLVPGHQSLSMCTYGHTSELAVEEEEDEELPDEEDELEQDDPEDDAVE